MSKYFLLTQGVVGVCCLQVLSSIHDYVRLVVISSCVVYIVHLLLSFMEPTGLISLGSSLSDFQVLKLIQSMACLVYKDCLEYSVDF